MKKSHFLAMYTLATAPLMGQTAQEIADNLSAPSLNAQGTQLVLPQVPEDASIELGGADYEQIIAKDGAVSPVISDTPVQVFFKVTKDGKTADSKDYELIVKAKDEPQGNAKPAVIPAILQWKGGEGVLDLKSRSSFLLCCGKEDEALGKELAAELEKELGVSVKVVYHNMKPDELPLISLRRHDRASKAPLGKEGYKLRIEAGEKSEKVDIDAESYVGLYWGTRTLLQILRTHEGKLPAGLAVDFPRYGLRGFMLDIARTHYSLKDLYDVVDTMAWFKMNDLHLVINNNFIFHEHYLAAGRDPFKESYTAFRLESKVKGEDGTPLTATDLFYTKAEFRALINYARAHGVNIVPEFDTPGHALSFTRVRPDLIYQGTMKRHPKRRCEMLDASSDETLRFVGEVMDEFLLKDEAMGCAVFDGCVMHIGADEFYGEAEDYRRYMDGLLRHVISRGYTPRVWGSLSSKPGKTPVVAKGVQMNLWNTGWMRAKEAVDLGFDVINTNDGALYIVPFANYYRMDTNHKWVYERWQPNVIGKETLPAGHPQLLGATFAIWNDTTDLLHQGYGMYDIWGAVKGSMDVLSQKMWGEKQVPGDFDRHRDLAARIGEAPGVNTLYSRPDSEKNISLPQETLSTCRAKLDLPAIGPDYHLTMELELTEETPGEEQVLLSGPEGKLIAAMKDGSIGFRRADAMEFSWDAKLPVGKKVKLEIIALPGQTRLLIDGQPVQKITLNNYRNAKEEFQKRTKDIICTFILPMQTLAESFHGRIYSFTVKPAERSDKK